jgi:steroid 5-alpha reductase family enzyme
MFLAFVVIESIADNQQFAFQTEKYRLKDAGKPLEGEYADGFNHSGLFSIVRKPNYAAEQAIWICFYLFSVASVQGEQYCNWSIIGCILLCMLFQGSGSFTEKITLTKYPKYREYMTAIPLYVPNPFQRVKTKGKSS